MTCRKRKRSDMETGLLVVLGVFTFLHVLSFTIPQGHVFDEVYYPKFFVEWLHAQTYEPFPYPHTTLGTLTIGLGILLLGDNAWGWRITSLLFALGTLTIFYMLCDRQYRDTDVPFAATWMLAFSVMFFSFGGLGVFDMMYLFFLVAGFYLWLGYRWHSPLTSGLAFGVSLAYKISLVPFAIPLLFMVERARGSLHIRVFAYWICAVMFGFMISLIIGELAYAGGRLDLMVDPVARMKVILSAHASMPSGSEDGTAAGTHPLWWLMASQPYKWTLETLTRNPFIAGFGAPTFAFAFGSIPAMVKRREYFVTSWFLTGYLLWLPLSILFLRPLYYFYALQFLPAVCIGNAIYLSWYKKLPLYLVGVTVFFLVLQYPWRAIL